MIPEARACSIPAPDHPALPHQPDILRERRGPGGHAGPDHALSAAADRARDDYLHRNSSNFCWSWWCDQVSVTLHPAHGIPEKWGCEHGTRPGANLGSELSDPRPTATPPPLEPLSGQSYEASRWDWSRLGSCS